ncbi:GM17560 [Drosophila sechellia]|uniref:GM17560 n=2 Tax=Drosophila sechellia TaxID=7238 RepID=B4IGC4_DROSE|nr:GM17560 [Drosophila sechellia]
MALVPSRATPKNERRLRRFTGRFGYQRRSGNSALSVQQATTAIPTIPSSNRIEMGATASCKKTYGSGYPEHDDPSYRKCQELKMERWIQMHYQIKQREQALAIAHHRELFYWLSGFYLSAVYGCASYYQRVRRVSALAPLLPLTFVVGYYTDWAYGSKMHRIQAEANMIMEHEQELLHWPGGLPTVAEIDEARVETEMEKKMHPHHM